jgi:DNA-binding SARP family transcriptional activator
MKFLILGPIRVMDGCDEDALRGTKQRTVLATLLLAAGRVVSDEQLADRLWDCDPPTTASSQIYTYVSRLRKFFAGELVINRLTTGYQMSIEHLDCDHIEFDQLSRKGTAALRDKRFAEAASLLRKALALWRGPALCDATDRLIEIESPQLQEAQTNALEARIDADLAVGRHRQLTAELAGLVSTHLLRERFRAQLMTALYRCDRQADAVATYHEGRTLLAEELGVDPGPELMDTYQQLLTGALALPMAGAWAGVTPAMLPRDLADFVGNEVELADIAGRVQAKSSGPIVITGMPGIGKTALAVHAAHVHAAAFPNGHLFAELHSPTGQQRPIDQVLGGFLVALGIPPQILPTGLDLRIQLYRSLMATKRMLVVLDDAETLEQIQPLIPTSSTSAAIITSQTSGTAPAGSSIIIMDPLGRQQARDLLGTIVGERRLQAEPQAVSQVLDCCGGLPLALRIAGRRLTANPGWRVTDLARRLHPKHDRVDELRAGDMSLHQRLQRGYSRLGTSHQSVMRRLGQSTATGYGVDFGVDLAQILDDLAERGLLDAGSRVRMHELTYLWARSLSDATPKTSSPRRTVPQPLLGTR